MSNVGPFVVLVLMMHATTAMYLLPRVAGSPPKGGKPSTLPSAAAVAAAAVAAEQVGPTGDAAVAASAALRAGGLADREDAQHAKGQCGLEPCIVERLSEHCWRLRRGAASESAPQSRQLSCCNCTNSKT